MGTDIAGTTYDEYIHVYPSVNNCRTHYTAWRILQFKPGLPPVVIAAGDESL
jgi:hypothetical protein